MSQFYDWLIAHPDQANALASVANLAVAVVALVVGGASIFLTRSALIVQRKHNELSVLPVPFIALADFENLVRVKVTNDGVGPLLVQTVDIFRNDVKNEFEDLVSYMPILPTGLSWSNFSSGLKRSILPGGELILLELKGDDFDPFFGLTRDSVRKHLSVLTVSVTFTDIYNRTFSPVQRTLDWFDRRLASSKTK